MITFSIWVTGGGRMDYGSGKSPIGEKVKNIIYIITIFNKIKQKLSAYIIFSFFFPLTIYTYITILLKYYV